MIFFISKQIKDLIKLSTIEVYMSFKQGCSREYGKMGHTHLLHEYSDPVASSAAFYDLFIKISLQSN